MRYYSTQRPIMPGSYPCRDKVVSITNFDTRTFCEDIGLEAYGYIEYSEPLSESEAGNYELVSEELKKYWCVCTGVYDDGHLVSHIVDTKLAARKPENSCKSLRRKDVYLDWFDSEEEALQHVEDAKNA